MSTTSAVITNTIDYTKIDPSKELCKNLWKGRMYKAAAIACLVVYTVLAIASAIAIGICAPIYLPIILTGAVIFADFVYNRIFTWLNTKAENHYSIAKENQGVANELKELVNKKDYNQARINYLKKRLVKCKTKKAHYTKLATEALANPKLKPKTFLNKAGQWVDKEIVSKIGLAYCQVLKKQPNYPSPSVVKVSFEIRCYVQKLLKPNEPIVSFQNGRGLNVDQLERLNADEITAMMLEPPILAR